MTFIACFDVATTTGCCDGRVGDKPRYWNWDLRDGGEGRPQRLLHLWNFLGAYLIENKVDRVFVEAPLNIGVMASMNRKDDDTGEYSKFKGVSDEVLQFLRGGIAIVELAAAAHQIPVDWWPVQSARKAVIGRATFPRHTAKREVMKYVRLLGYEPDDDNTADAIVGWLYESALLNPRTALHTTPLFGAAGAR
jgi:hypothetical protein